ncbi:WD40/YVTN/BNR-like repeat-containing protein [Halorussus amylolyticus]|uniref:WD40/YVTN/BNR-like repeat-containing protein n=1 Tax=Halorussus amylolyticus TaxID=1126242 RepID=UPI001045B307|nr:glycosyl hydrolase [Halorussus amylolyticus]
MLLVGTYDGVYRADRPRFESAERTLDSGRVLRVRRFDDWRGVFAATKTGLYRSTDEGASWTDLGVPREEVYSVVGDPDGERLYAGTHPAHLYVSEDDGESWTELEGFQDLPSREEWYTPRHRDEAHIRSLGAHADARDRVVAGVEVGGVHVSDDRGETWTERKQGVHDDVHHVLILGPGEYVASCGGGLYRTRDAGETWMRLDEALDHTYFREAFFHGGDTDDGVLYAAAARSSPGTWSGETGADAALFESRDGGDTFEALDYPGRPEEVVLAWTAHDGGVVAGTNDGRVLVRETDGWVTGGEVPAGVSSLCGV